MTCKSLRHLSICLIPLLLSGCATFMTSSLDGGRGQVKEGETPSNILVRTDNSKEFILPDAFILEGGSEERSPLEWWQAFESEELNALEERALSSLFTDDKKSGNFDMQLAFLRLDQTAYSFYRSFASGHIPSITYSSSMGGDRYSNVDDVLDSGKLSFSLSYEFDLWGKVAAATLADRKSYKASYEDVLTTILTISGNVATTYIDILSARAEIKMYEEQMKLNTSVLEMQKTRFAHGQVTSLDLLQQQANVLKSESEKPVLIEKERALLASLAILMGELPTTPIEITEKQLPKLPPLPETGVPVDLLINRPDVRAAYLRLEASDLDLSVAKLVYFPNIRLSASDAFNLLDLPSALAEWSLNFAASISGIVFDGGTRRASRLSAKAATEEAAVNYVKTVANALNEVNTALMAEITQVNYIENLKQQLDLQERASKEALNRYMLGTDTFSRYLSQIQSLQTLQGTLLKEEASLLKLRITLYKSLGITI